MSKVKNCMDTFNAIFDTFSIHVSVIFSLTFHLAILFFLAFDTCLFTTFVSAIIRFPLSLHSLLGLTLPIF